MPRDKAPHNLDGGLPAQVGDLPEITERQGKFVAGILSHGNASKAYRDAFPDSQAQPKTINVMASKLKNSDNIRVWIDALRADSADALQRDTVEAWRNVGWELLVDAKRSGNYGAAVNAWEKIGRHHGRFEDRHTHTYDLGDNITGLLKRAAEAKGIDYARQLAGKYGINLPDGLLIEHE